MMAMAVGVTTVGVSFAAVMFTARVDVPCNEGVALSLTVTVKVSVVPAVNALTAEAFGA